MAYIEALTPNLSPDQRMQISGIFKRFRETSTLLITHTQTNILNFRENGSVEIRPLITTILESEFSGIATRLQQYILIMQRQMMSYMADMNGPNGRLNESSIQQINNNPQSLEEWSRSTQNLIAANFNEMQSLIAHINIEIRNTITLQI